MVVDKPLEKISSNCDKSDKSKGGFLVCGVWLPKLGQVFAWRVLRNPVFLMITFSVVTGRSAGFGRITDKKVERD